MTGSHNPRRAPNGRCRRCGKTLIEVVLVVTGVAALVATAGTTLHAVHRVGRTAHAAADRGTAIARLHRTFAEDAAAADAVSVDGKALTFTSPGDTAVVYAVDGDAVTRRSVAEPVGRGERFAVAADGITFAADGGRASVAFDRAGTPDGFAEGLSVNVVAYAGGSE